MPSLLKYSGYNAPTQLTTWLMLCCAKIALSRATASPDTYSPSATYGGGMNNTQGMVTACCSTAAFSTMLESAECGFMMMCSSSCRPADYC